VFRRVFWLAVGLGAGATAVVMANRWAQKQAARMAPANLAREASNALRELGTVLADAAKDFRTGMAERESEIRSSLP
jgi:hypothetical protein